MPQGVRREAGHVNVNIDVLERGACCLVGTVGLWDGKEKVMMTDGSGSSWGWAVTSARESGY